MGAEEKAERRANLRELHANFDFFDVEALSRSCSIEFDRSSTSLL